MDFKLTQKIIDDLFEIYKIITGSSETRFPKSNDIQQALNDIGHFEYRAGSRWSGHSKFIIDNHTGVSFYANYDPTNKKEAEKIEKAEQLFKETVKNYLKKKGA